MFKKLQLLGWALLATGLVGCNQNTAVDKASEQVTEVVNAQVNTFTNPIFPNGADPWLEYFEGNYYLTTTTWTSQLVMRKSPTLAGLASATPIHIWSESVAERCCNFWAFEFHRLNSPKGPRWYVMYTSGTADNYDHQHLSVIESQGDDPMGPYTYKGSPMPDTWNIDGTYFEHQGQLYLLWSEWQGDSQLVWIAKMENPWTITGDKVIISRPTYDWEKSGMKVNEGPEILQRNGKTYLVYSASFCNTPDYKLGLIELTGADPLIPESWHKFDQPVFSKANGVFGPGHNGFFSSPDGTEDWLIYHGNASELEGCSSTRSLRAQKFTWNDDGTPNFGEPVAAGQAVISPSGENGPLVTQVQGAAIQLINKAKDTCLASERSSAISADCASKAASWRLDYTTQGHYRLVNDAGLFLSQCADDGVTNLSPWFNRACQEWSVNANQEGWISLVNVHTNAELMQSACTEPAPEQKAKDVEDIPNLIPPKASCVQWRIQPRAAQAIVSVQSGKALSAENNGNLAQDEWKNAANQRWQFVSTDNGFYQIHPQHKLDSCVTLANKSIVPGTNIELGACGDLHSQWAVDFLEDGTVRLRNRRSNLMMDLASCGLANHTNIAEGQWLNTACQKFQLKIVD